MTNRIALAAAALALSVAPRLSRADRRYYGETYNAATAPRGALDVELWTSLHQSTRDLHEPQYWRHELELETGITDRWDVALYNIVRAGGFDDGFGGTRYEATKIETRYRLSDPGQWFVDPILYLELRKEWVNDTPFAVEEKVILGKDMGPVNLSLNVLAEQEFIPAGGNELEYGYALGASYELHPMIRVGAEVFGSTTHKSLEGAWVNAHYAGPAVSLAVARSWLVLAAGFGLTDESERMRLRAVLAFQF